MTDIVEQKRVSILIPTYNASFLLKQYLPSVIKAIKFRGNIDEIIIIDDGSTDTTKKDIKNKFPKIKYIRFKENKGFIKAINYGVRKSKYKIVISLNNDVEVDYNFINPLIKHFEDKDVFAVSSKILLPDEEMANEAVTSVFFYRGEFLLRWPGLRKKNKFNNSCEILYGCGAATAYHKKKFLELKGFDNLFYPYYAEDLDISYRAWQRGWKVIYEPESIVYHKRSSTIKKGIKRKIIEKRNLFLFTWKNVRNINLLISHFFWCIFFLIKAVIKKDRIYIKSFLQALIIYLRKNFLYGIRINKKIRIKDKEILNKFKKLR